MAQTFPPDSLPDVHDKVVLIYQIGSRDPQSNSSVVHPRFEMQSGRLFLCGEPAPGDTPNDWIVGCRLCLAWDTIETYIVFESIEDYAQRVHQGRSTTSVQ